MSSEDAAISCHTLDLNRIDALKEWWTVLNHRNSLPVGLEELLTSKRSFRVTIDLSPEIEARLKARVRADGISVGEYVGRLVSEEESRRVRVAAFEEAIRERLESLSSGETVDGEEVMARLLAELNGHRVGSLEPVSR